MPAIRGARTPDLRVAVVIRQRRRETVVVGLAQRVRGERLIALRHAFFDFEQQRLVVIVGARLPEVDPYELRVRPHTGRLIRQVDLHRIAIAIAHHVGHIGRHGHVGRQTPADADVDLMRVHVDLPVAADGDRRRRVAEERLARPAAERIRERRIENRDRFALRPGQLAKVLQRPHVVVEEPVRRVKIGNAVARRIPSHPDPRSEVVVIAAIRPRLRKDRDVVRERSVASELVLNLREQPRQIFVERADLEIVPKAKIERQSLRRLPVVLQVAREHSDRNVRVGRQRVRVLGWPGRAIVRVVRRVLRERPAAERRLGVVTLERHVAEIEAHLPLVGAAAAAHEIGKVVFQLPSAFRSHLRVAAAADENRRIAENRRADRQARGEVAGRVVAVRVRWRHFVFRIRVLEAEIVQRAVAQHR